MPTALAPRVAAFAGLAGLGTVMLTGCPRPAKRPERPPLEEPSGPDPSDRAALETDLAAAIRESYQSLSDGYEEAYLESLARDRRLVMIDVGPDDVLVGYDATACQLRRQFTDDAGQFVSKRLEVHVSADGTAGWSYDEISYRVLHEGRRAIIPLRATTVFERRSGRWLVVQQHVSYGIPIDDAWRLAGAASAQPAALPDWTAPVPEASAARDIVARLITDTDDARANHITDDDRLLVIGVDSGTELRGAAARERDTVRALFGYDFQVKRRDLRVKTSATGQIAWAAANVVVDDGGSGADRRELPLRVTYVLEKAAGEWRVVQMHVSAGVTSQELSLRVFGETVL